MRFSQVAGENVIELGAVQVERRVEGQTRAHAHGDDVGHYVELLVAGAAQLARPSHIEHGGGATREYVRHGNAGDEKPRRDGVRDDDTRTAKHEETQGRIAQYVLDAKRLTGAHKKVNTCAGKSYAEVSAYAGEHA